MSTTQKRRLARILVALLLFAIVFALAETGTLAIWFGRENALAAEFALFLLPYLLAGYEVLWRAAHNVVHGRIFDENLLMSVATIGAFALVFFPESDPHMAEGAAVMLFYQIGEFFEDYAVDKTRRSIADMLDIAPEYANIQQDGKLLQVDPYDVAIGSEIVIKPGERVPLDGVVVAGASQLDTAALTGESTPRHVEPGQEVISGCVNMTGLLTVRTTKEYGDSTVQRILELVETAADKKARTESFITRFARYYTPIVVCIAAALAVLPPLVLGGEWADWIQRGLIFLVVSCPCALVISVPLSFFGGIGAASRKGILVKGSNYLEALAHVDTVVFDKTGTLTSGTFSVIQVQASSRAPGIGSGNGNAGAPESGSGSGNGNAGAPASGSGSGRAESVSPAELIALAAYAEAYSDHPIALSVKAAYGEPIDTDRISNAQESSGHGVMATVDGRTILAGNGKLMAEHGIAVDEASSAASGTVLHVARDGSYLGWIAIADTLKADAADSLAQLRAAGVKSTVMLTGDCEAVAENVARELGIDRYCADLLPQGKVRHVETLLEETAKRTDGKGKVAFVGDGINDAPVLMRADVGIAMGAMGSDAAIEAADIVLMDDRPSNIATAVRIARKTMGIVHQNIVFALGVKFGVLILAAFGMANLWLAVFADVGVAVLAILNAMRTMRA